MLKDFFTHVGLNEGCKTNERLSELGEIDSINLMNSYVSHQELIEHCFTYNIYRGY